LELLNCSVVLESIERKDDDNLILYPAPVIADA
jgi:hypothetical protein